MSTIQPSTKKPLPYFVELYKRYKALSEHGDFRSQLGTTDLARRTNCVSGQPFIACFPANGHLRGAKK